MELTKEQLANKRGRKFLGTSHQSRMISQEEAEKEAKRIPGLHYIKIAMERSEEKKEHLQFYIEVEQQISGKALSKKLNKINKDFWNSAHIDFSVLPHIAINYPGNLDFKHKDGDNKGGEVLWVIEIGKPYKNDGQKDKQKGAWKAKLLEMKKAIDDGQDVMFLWDNYFDIMIQTGKSFRDYIRDKELSYKNSDEAKQELKKIDEDFLAIHTEIAELKRTNESLCQEIWRLKGERDEIVNIAKLQQSELEKIELPL